MMPLKNIMDIFDEVSSNKEIVSNTASMAKIINSLRYIKQYIDNEEAQIFNNKEFNKEKSKINNNLKLTI